MTDWHWIAAIRLCTKATSWPMFLLVRESTEYWPSVDCFHRLMSSSIWQWSLCNNSVFLQLKLWSRRTLKWIIALANKVAENANLRQPGSLPHGQAFIWRAFVWAVVSHLPRHLSTSIDTFSFASWLSYLLNQSHLLHLLRCSNSFAASVRSSPVCSGRSLLDR